MGALCGRSSLPRSSSPSPSLLSPCPNPGAILGNILVAWARSRSRFRARITILENLGMFWGLRRCFFHLDCAWNWFPVHFSSPEIVFGHEIEISVGRLRVVGLVGLVRSLWRYSWGGDFLFSDVLLVSLLSVFVIKHRLALERALVQWRFLRELSKGYLCGHRYSLGTVLLLDDMQSLCVSWRLVSLRSATWECLGEARSSVKS